MTAIANGLSLDLDETSLCLHGMHYADGIIVQPEGLICFLNLERMFENVARHQLAAA